MLYEQALEAVAAIRTRSALQPSIALILGSGLGGLANEIEDAITIPYEEIPHFARSTAEGHVGCLLIGRLEGVPVVVMQGRFHYYEGYSAQTLTFPVRVMALLGAQTLIVTNAAGGVNPAYRPGEFMILRDHINLAGMVGVNPLIGPNDERFGLRFPPVADAYTPELRALAHSVADEHPEMALHEGIYTMVTGPSFESKAELKFLRLIGTDAVGMSTLPEVLVACHMGMCVLGISLISNTATGDDKEKVNHVEVLATADAARPRFATLVRGILRKIAS